LDWTAWCKNITRYILVALWRGIIGACKSCYWMKTAKFMHLNHFHQS
jgi:hypothetical protein